MYPLKTPNQHAYGNVEEFNKKSDNPEDMDHRETCPQPESEFSSQPPSKSSE